MKFLIINGPNLNLLGTREPSIYGSKPMDDFLIEMVQDYPEDTIDYFQSNHEGDIIDCLQESGEYDGVVLNPGAYTHTSLAITDCLRAIDTPVIEVHISNIAAREEWRHSSLIAPHCLGSISGLGLNGYRLAIDALKLLRDENSRHQS